MIAQRTTAATPVTMAAITSTMAGNTAARVSGREIVPKRNGGANGGINGGPAGGGRDGGFGGANGGAKKPGGNGDGSAGSGGGGGGGGDAGGGGEGAGRRGGAVGGYGTVESSVLVAKSATNRSATPTRVANTAPTAM